MSAYCKQYLLIQEYSTDAASRFPARLFTLEQEIVTPASPGAEAPGDAGVEGQIGIG